MSNTSMSLPLWLFWGSTFLIVYTYFLFPLILVIRGRIRPKAIKRGSDIPFASLIIAAYNEEDVIESKIQNSIDIDYPIEKLEIIIASNGSSDKTVDLATKYQNDRIHLLDIKERGKNSALNKAVAGAKGDILIFTDADSLMDRKSLQYLVSSFADDTVGAVGGNYFYDTKVKSEEGTGERTYWSFDRLMKEAQSQAGSMTSATGQLYAIRRELFKPIPSGVTDDFFTSTQAQSAFKRLVFEPQATITGPVADNKGEYRRKVRVMTRGLNSVRAQKHLLNPFQYGSYSIQLFTHKILRRFVIFPLVIMYCSLLFLWNAGLFYQLAGIGAAIFGGITIVAYAVKNRPIGQKRVFSLPLYFFMVNVAACSALANLIKGKRIDVWSAERTT
ncbi:MAG: cellulose synthase/poly-beta-1,6-N-acetylglucosamine synthase-like glycosyltransferase [Ulvibacter sp.]|jgi:cellulose synthase/poly-beta-1,6-N-acetylglucosamine synthase-like glycosyltransferase